MVRDRAGLDRHARLAARRPTGTRECAVARDPTGRGPAPDDSMAGAMARLALADGGAPLVLVPRAVSPAETVVRLLEGARVRGALLLALALAAFVGAVW